MGKAGGVSPASWGAGVTYAVTKNIDLDLGYRFNAVSSVDFDDNGDTFDNGKLYSHKLQLGVTLKFLIGSARRN